MHDRDAATSGGGVSRRRFMGVAASAAAGSLLSMRDASAEGRLRLPPGTPRARVVHTHSAHVIRGRTVHRTLLDEMLQETLTSLTGTASVRNAWHSILKPDDVIGLKFSRSARRIIGTTDAMAEVLVSSIVRAGWSPDRIICLEVAPELEERLGTKRATPGYRAEPVDFGSGTDRFAAALDQMTALINVPFLKTHNIAGITGALKNLSHGLVMHPARYHGNGCAPYIGDIVAAPPIRSRLRLCLVNAIRVVFDGGPAATAQTLSDDGGLLASFDPVAVDLVGLAAINDTRRRMDLEPVARSAEEIGYLAAAHRLGLGVAVWHGIDLRRLRL